MWCATGKAAVVGSTRTAGTIGPEARAASVFSPQQQAAMRAVDPQS
jgi:hypothetical protein